MPIPNNARLFETKLEHKLMKTRITGQHTYIYIVITSEQETKLGMGSYFVSLAIALALVQAVVADGSVRMKSELLCSQCKKCDTDKCPPSDSYPHMTAFDNSLIAGALQSDYVRYEDRGVYSVPNVEGGVSTNNRSYFGWESTSGSASGYHR